MFYQILFSLIFLLVSGCATTNGANENPYIEGQPGEPVELEIGQSAQIKGDSGELILTFVEVAEDSRCPEGATCVWEGKAAVSVHLSSSGGTDELVEMRIRAGHESTSSVVDNWRITFLDLLPYPVVDEEPEAVIAVFVIEED